MKRTQLYQLLRQATAHAPKANRGVAILVAVFVVIVSFAVLHVRKRQEVLRVGFDLARSSSRVAHLREVNRKLDIELAMLSAPERIRTLAVKLGMIAIPPDQIRVIHATEQVQATLSGGNNGR